MTASPEVSSRQNDKTTLPLITWMQLWNFGST